RSMPGGRNAAKELPAASPSTPMNSCILARGCPRSTRCWGLGLAQGPRREDASKPGPVISQPDELFGKLGVFVRFDLAIERILRFPHRTRMPPVGKQVPANRA